MKLKPNEPITEDHFQGTFIFPDDLDFLGDICKTPFLCAIFNDMVKDRLSANKLVKS
jgi:hypothetical protein